MKALITCLLLAASASSPAAEKPNIIVILVDDMGFSDLGCYGSEIPTPHLDALAAEGVRFSQFYNTGRCCPTRASLLTGLYPHQAGVGHMTEDQGQPGYQGRLNDSCVTLAEVLKPAGYFTIMSGKWHVGQNLGVTPLGRGFDRSLNPAAGGFYFGESSRFDLSLNGEKIAADDPRLPRNWYSTDLWTDFALRFIDEALAEKKPFYLHLCHNAPHFPLQAPAEAIAKFRGKYLNGWGAIRDQRLARQREMGLIDAGWEKAPRPAGVQPWKDVPTEERDRFDHLMAVYAACVHLMDQSVGNLVAGLKARGLYENTLLLFMSDNGGNAESGPKGRTEGDPTKADSNWFCGESWAFPQNTPFRLYKHYNHEGGIASPLIAHWPAGLKTNPSQGQGNWVTTPAHLIDIMATCVEVSGATYPEAFHGKSVQPMEGTSLLPAMRGESLPERSLFWEHEGNAAVRSGDWKLVREGRQGAWELYDLKNDRTEQSNLAEAQPEKARALAAQWQAWAERAQVLPYPEDKGKKGGKGQKKAKK